MPNCIGAERVRLRLSQTDLGDKIGVSRSIIVRIERDPKSATYDQLEKMSQLSVAPSNICLAKPMIVFPRRTRLRNERQRKVGAVGE